MSELTDDQSARKEARKDIIRLLHAGRSVDEVKAKLACFCRPLAAARSPTSSRR